MFPKSVRLRFAVIFTILLTVSVFSMVRFGPTSLAEKAAMLLSSNAEAETNASPGLLAPNVTATKTDLLINDGPGGVTPDDDGDGKADPGETIEYTVQINNAGVSPADDASGVQFSDTIDANTTLTGNVSTSAVAVNDTFPVTVVGNVEINSGQLAVPFSVTANDFLGLPSPPPGSLISSFDTTTANGGTVSLSPSTGFFTYDPPPGFTGTDTFTYTLTDNANAPTAASNRTATVSITVSGMVWFIDNNAAACTTVASGCGRLSNPYSTLAAFEAENGDADVPASDLFYPAAGDNIFIYESATAYLGGLTLLANQKLIGQDSTSTLSAITGLTPPTGSPAFPAMNTGAPATTIQNAAGNSVTLGTNNILNGFTASNATGGSSIFGNAFVAVTVNDVIVNTNTQALNLTNGASGAGGVNFTSITSTGGTNCVSLVSLAGTFSLGGGALSASSGACFVVGAAGGGTGGTVTVNYSGTVTKTSGGRVVAIMNKTGGSVNFTGAVSGTGVSTGIRLDSNTGATVNFMGGLVMSTSTGDAFSATGGGTLNICDENPCNPAATGGLVNTLTTTTGTALNVASTTIGANSLEFRSISAGTGAGSAGVGISLNTTGSSAGLKVKGNGTAGSGGTIQRKTGANGSTTAGIGIFLNSTTAPSFAWMQLNDFENYAIRGENVVGFTLANSVISSAGGASWNGNSAADDEGSVSFSNLTGSASITNSNISGGFEDNFRVVNTSGSLNRITFDTVTIGPNHSGATALDDMGNGGIKIETLNSANINATVQNCIFTSSRGDLFGFNSNASSGATDDLIFNNNTLTNNYPRIATGGGGTSILSNGNKNFTFHMEANSFRDAVGTNLLLAKSTGNSTYSGTVSNNTIGVAATANSGSSEGSGMKIQNAGQGTVTMAVTDNDIFQYNNNGIEVLAGGGAMAFAGNLNLTITGNTVSNAGNNPNVDIPKNAIHFNIGTVPGDTYFACANVSANNIFNGGKDSSTPTIGDNDIRLRARQLTTIRMPGYAGGNQDTTAAQNFAIANNSVGGVPTALAFSSNPTGGFVGGAACTTPPPSALSIDDEARSVFNGFDNKIAFLGASDDSFFDSLARRAEPIVTNEALQPIDGIPSDGKVSGPVADTIVNAVAEGTVGLTNYGVVDRSDSSNIPFVRELAIKLYSAIMPTVFSQEVERPVVRRPDDGQKRTEVRTQNATMSGETVNVAVGTLPAGKSVTVKFRVTVDGPALPLGTTRILNQGTVNFDTAQSVQTNDPDAPLAGACSGLTGPPYATCTVVDRPDTTIVSLNRFNPATSPTNADSVTWRAVFNDPIIGLTTGNFQLDVGAGVTGATILSVTPVDIADPSLGAPYTTWEITTNNTIAGNGTLGIDLANDTGVSHDVSAPGPAALPFSGQDYVIDNLAPSTTSFLRQSPLAMDTNADVLIFRATFSEDLANVDITDFAVNSTTTATVTGISPITGTSVYDVTVSGGDLVGFNGTVNLNLAVGQNITDLAGNALPNTEPAPAANDQTYNVDNTAPTVDITDVSPDPRNTAVSSITIVFSESVTGFDLADLSLTLDSNPVALTGATLTSGDGGMTWTLGNLAGLTAADGTYLLTLNAPDGIMDAAGNLLQTGATEDWEMDATSPSVTINQAAGQNDPTPNNPINFTVVFSEPVTDFDGAADVDLSTSTAGALTHIITEIAPNDGTTYNVAVNGAVTDGTVVATVPAGVAIDAATNPNAASTSTDNTVTFITCVTPPANMVGWWTGDGHANDIAGGNDASISGTVTYAAGKVGEAFSFSGAGFVTEPAGAPSPLNFTGNQVTIDGWINPTTLASDAVFFGKTVSGNNDYLLLYQFGNISAIVKTGGTETTVNTSVVPPLNAWTHIALTYDGANMRVYINGVDSGSTAKTGNITGSNAPFNIGGRTGSLFFNGLVDEVEVFDRALSQAEIQAIVDADSGGKCKPSDLNIVKSDGGATAVPGGTITYTLDYANHGEPASGVVLTETVPANTTFTSAGSTAGWSCANGAPAGTNCTLNVGSLATNQTGSAAFVVTVINPVPAGVTQTSNTASISDGTTELDTADNTSTDTTPITAAPDLSLSKDDGGASVVPGGTVSYTLTYTNNGNQAATGVTLTETVPANTTFNAGASTAGWTCLPDNTAGSTCTFNVGAVAGGGGTGNVTFAVTVVNPVAAGVNEISNTASVADDGTNGADPTANNSATDTTPVNAQPDLGITKTDGGVSTFPGNTFSYTLGYTNTGNQAATGVVITDTVPANTTFHAGASTLGWTCLPDGNAGSTCTFVVGALSAGSGGSVAFAVTLPTTGLLGVTQISNTASISDDGNNGVDPTPGNNSASDTTPRGCQPITVNNPANDTGLLGTPFSETFTQTGGFGTLTYTLASGTLPNGITLSSAGVLSGTPTQSGLFPITVKVTDENGCEATSVTYNLNITCNVNPVVFNSNNDGVDSLRYAVATACPNSTITFGNGLPGGTDFTDATPDTISLTTGQIVLDKDLTIQGPGADVLTVQNTQAASPTSRIFLVNGGVTATVSGLSISGGLINVGFGGGGILNNGGTLTVIDSIVTGNSAPLGGGISNIGTASVTNSTISGNSAPGNIAGGILNNGTLTVTNSTISGNSASSGSGGGIVNSSGVTTVTNSTISNNSATNGGGIYRSGGTVNSLSSIIAGNMAPTGPDVFDNLSSQGYNLIGNNSDATITPSPGTADQIGTGVTPLDPQLLPLANNGGRTETHALIPTSPAVDKGSAFGLTTDQRGETRPFDVASVTDADDGSDIGAYELNTIPTTTTLTSSGSPSVFGQTVTFTATVETDPASATVVTGNVDFFDGANPIVGCQDVALVAGVAECMTSTLSVGAHTIMAEFDENLPFLASSDTIAHQVNKADTTTAVGSSNNPSVFGESVTFTATVAASAPGSGTPTGTVTFTVDGNPTCVNVALNGAGQAACTPAGPLSVGNHPVSVTYSGDTNYNASAGSLPTQVVNKANTTIQITGDTPDPTLVGEPYTVTWQVTVVAPGAGVPTGTVTVTDGTDSCTAPVAAGSCVMTSTTVGIKNLVATYSGDGNFNGSVSAAAQHTVNIKISGNVRHFPGMNGIAGITVTLTGANGGSVFTGVDGYYEFVGVFTGDYTVTPSGPVPGKSYDPISRSFTNVLASISGVDFVAYDTSEDAPRKLRVVSQNVLPGSAVVVPIVITAQGNETSVEFSIEYDPAQFAGPPTVACGSGAGVGCTLVTDYSQPGRVGIKVTPMDGTFAAGEREVVRLTFQTLNTLAADTPVDLIGSPTNLTVTDANGDPLLVELMSGFIIYQTLPAQEGLEGDVAARFTGDGQVLSNDVILVRQMAVGLITTNAAFNEFQRADSAPRATLGDGQITTGDVIQTRRYGAGIDPPTPAGGPFGPMMAEPPPAMLSAGETVREVRVMRARGVAGERVTIPVEMKTTGDEMAVSFTLEYDARKLTGPTVTLAGAAPADAVLTVNDKVSGRLTILIDAGTPFSAAGGQLVSVTFDAAQTAPAGETAITITSVSVADANASEMSSAYASGTVTIDNANAPGVRISGRVLTPTRGGLSNAQVTITDAKGARRTVLTSSAGYYQFDAVAAGRGYQITVSSRRYRFTPRAIEASADLTNIDLIAQE